MGDGRLELHWTPFWTYLNREIRRFLRVLIQTLVTPVVNSSLYLLIFGVSLGRSLIMEQVTYLGFLIPGIVMMAALNNAFQNSSSSIVSMKFTGELEDLRVSPLSEIQMVLALAVGGLVRGLMVGGISLIVGETFYWIYNSQFLGIQHPFTLLFFIVVGGLSFSMMGISIAFWARTVDQLSAISAFVLLPLLYLGGVFFSIKSLPPFWGQMARLNPLLYLINGVRLGILGQSDVSFLSSAAVAMIFLIITFIGAYFVMNRGSYQRW